MIEPPPCCFIRGIAAWQAYTWVKKLSANARCDGLMDAQHAYGEAMRSTDAHWIAMSGFRVGEMYRKLHHDLMVIPPTLLAKSDKQKQIFFAIMHVRYRVLLEKVLSKQAKVMTGAEWMAA